MNKLKINHYSPTLGVCVRACACSIVYRNLFYTGHTCFSVLQHCLRIFDISEYGQIIYLGTALVTGLVHTHTHAHTYTHWGGGCTPIYDGCTPIYDGCTPIYDGCMPIYDGCTPIYVNNFTFVIVSDLQF